MVKTSPLQLLKYLKQELTPLYGDESNSLAMLITEFHTKLSRTDIIADTPALTGPQFNLQVSKTVDRLKAREPIQYILGQSHFYGHEFKVTPATLIPRPETEELVDLIIKETSSQTGIKILDIGTGSGCIAISLCLALEAPIVTAIDISAAAIEVASENGQFHKAPVTFKVMDVLSDFLTETYDLIVSNPPYVRESEKKFMQSNVLDFEPQQALYVSDDSPLVYYTRIGQIAFEHLTSGGRLYFEINESFGEEIRDLLTAYGFEKVSLIKDFMGKDRIISASRP